MGACVCVGLYIRFPTLSPSLFPTPVSLPLIGLRRVLADCNRSSQGHNDVGGSMSVYGKAGSMLAPAATPELWRSSHTTFALVSRRRKPLFYSPAPAFPPFNGYVAVFLVSDTLNREEISSLVSSDTCF